MENEGGKDDSKNKKSVWKTHAETVPITSYRKQQSTGRENPYYRGSRKARITAHISGWGMKYSAL
jgi:hypothetical protein